MFISIKFRVYHDWVRIPNTPSSHGHPHPHTYTPSCLGGGGGGGGRRRNGGEEGVGGGHLWAGMAKWYA